MQGSKMIKHTKDTRERRMALDKSREVDGVAQDEKEAAVFNDAKECEDSEFMERATQHQKQRELKPSGKVIPVAATPHVRTVEQEAALNILTEQLKALTMEEDVTASKIIGYTAQLVDIRTTKSYLSQALSGLRASINKS